MSEQSKCSPSNDEASSQQKPVVPIAQDASLYGDYDTGHLSNSRYAGAMETPILVGSKEKPTEGT